MEIPNRGNPQRLHVPTADSDTLTQSSGLPLDILDRISVFDIAPRLDDDDMAPTISSRPARVAHSPRLVSGTTGAAASDIPRSRSEQRDAVSQPEPMPTVRGFEEFEHGGPEDIEAGRTELPEAPDGRRSRVQTGRLRIAAETERRMRRRRWRAALMGALGLVAVGVVAGLIFRLVQQDRERV